MAIDKKNLMIGGAILVGLYILNPFSGREMLNPFSGHATIEERGHNFASNHLLINDFVGKIHLTPSNDGKIHIEMSNLSADTNPKIDHVAGRLEINGAEKIGKSSCYGFSFFSWGQDNKSDPNISINKHSSQKLSQFPVLNIQAPQDIKLTLNKNIIFGSFSNIDELDLTSYSCSQLDFNQVTHDVNIDLKGSGNIDVDLVGGSANINLQGSGDVIIGTVKQDSQTNLRGSVNVLYNRLNGINKMHIQGSGDISTDVVNGDVEALIQGSGNITLHDGDLNWFIATVQGSGNIEFGGTANNTRFVTKGSGDIDSKYN